MLTEGQIQRYARQLLLPEIGGAGQERLLAARVAVRAAGASGEALAIYLAAAGVSLGEGGLAVGSLEAPERWLLSDSGAAWAPADGPCPSCVAGALAELPAPPDWARPAAAQAAGAIAASEILLQLAGRGAATPSLWSVWPRASRGVVRRRAECRCG